MSAKPVSVNPRAPLRRHEIPFRQTPSASPLKRSLFPSRLALAPVRRREARLPCACLSVAANAVYVYPPVPVPRRKLLALFPIGFMQPLEILDCGLRLKGQAYDCRYGYWRVRDSGQNRELTRREMSRSLALYFSP